jgi:hypothetical protein
LAIKYFLTYRHTNNTTKNVVIINTVGLLTVAAAMLSIDGEHQ